MVTLETSKERALRLLKQLGLLSRPWVREVGPYDIDEPNYDVLSLIALVRAGAFEEAAAECRGYEGQYDPSVPGYECRRHGLLSVAHRLDARSAAEKEEADEPR